MTIIGAVLNLGFAAIAVAAAAVVLWSGWLALRDEIRPGFKSVRPGPGGIVLTLIGVVFPVVMIALFTLYLAIWLINVSFAAL